MVEEILVEKIAWSHTLLRLKCHCKIFELYSPSNRET